MKKIILISFLFQISNFINAQQQDSIFLVSPLIGDTLGLHERDYYQLFPGIPGFKWAVFYLNNKKMLSAKIRFLKNNEEKDSLINTFASIDELKDHLNSIQTEKEEAANDQFFEITLKSGEQLKGKLISVRKNKLIFFKNENIAELESDSLVDILPIKFDSVSTIKLLGESNVVKGILIGTGVGLAVGAVWGAVDYKPRDELEGFAKVSYLPLGTSIVVGAFFCGAAGLCIGLAAGLVSSSSDFVIQPQSQEDFYKLKPNSLYPDFEPEIIRKIK